jgi:hypothetical protein
MRYFSYIAEQSFKTTEDGKRLFYRGGPWSKPYVIPDAETEAALLRRQTIFLRCSLGPIIFGQPIVFGIWPKLMYQPAIFLGYLSVTMALVGFANWLTHRHSISGLQRLEHRLPLRSFYQGMADKHSAGALTLGFVGSLLFVCVGYMILARQLSSAKFIGWFCICFFALCALAWGYAIMLKRSSKTVGHRTEVGRKNAGND